MIVNIFWQDECPYCPLAKQVGKDLESVGIIVRYHNIGNPDGMSEALFYKVLASPSIVVTDGKDEVVSWRGKDVPTVEEVLGAVNGRA
ncbi:MAG: thioredoxin family protein [Candidatus Bathyarchaeota archaeon]|nr:thioredoxin family protein [Candidatus Bathyarchaeota archaeon]